MIERYSRAGKALTVPGLALQLVGVVMALWLAPSKVTAIALIPIGAGILLLAAGAASYAKAKGHSPLWGLTVPLFWAGVWMPLGSVHSQWNLLGPLLLFAPAVLPCLADKKARSEELIVAGRDQRTRLAFYSGLGALLLPYLGIALGLSALSFGFLRLRELRRDPLGGGKAAVLVGMAAGALGICLWTIVALLRFV